VKEITWRDATADDVGLLARFWDIAGDDYTYGRLSEIEKRGEVQAFVCEHSEEFTEPFHHAEVQEVVE